MSARARPTLGQLASRVGKRANPLLRAMLWNGAAPVLSRGLPVLGMIFAARILGREAFGELGIAYSTAMMLQVFAVAGLGTTATTFIARWRKADPERAGRRSAPGAPSCCATASRSCPAAMWCER